MENRSAKPNLANSLVGQPDATKVLYVLHGIFGSGRNWSSVMRRFVRDRPEWRVRLIDLRQHGDSQGFAGPHTIAAAATDLATLAKGENETPQAILGHSFGGKVALMYARHHAQGLEQVWIIDSTPEARAAEGSAWRMLETVRSTPRDFASRDELIGLLTQADIALPTAQWMATNLERDEATARYRWRFDFDSLEEMMRDFFNEDLWDVVEQPPAGTQIHLVKARESSVLTPGAIERIHQAGNQIFLHEVDGGHWVNAENPDALLALMTEHL